MPGPVVLRPEQMYPAGDAEAHARFVTTAPGIRVRIVEASAVVARVAAPPAPCAPPAPGAPPVLLLHGWGCSAYSFRFLLPSLAHAGLRAVTLDMQGHGLSDKPTDRSAYTLSAMTRHVAQVMDALEINDATVVGHSMGGRIAAELGIQHSDRVRHLVLINPVGFGPMPHISAARPFARRGLVALLPTPLPASVIRIPVSAGYGRLGRPTAQDVAEYRAPTQFRAFLRASAHLVRVFDWSLMEGAAMDRLRTISSLILGARDRVVQTVLSGESESLIKAGWKVRVVADVAHVVHEEAPAEVMAFFC